MEFSVEFMPSEGGQVALFNLLQSVIPRLRPSKLLCMQIILSDDAITRDHLRLMTSSFLVVSSLVMTS